MVGYPISVRPDTGYPAKQRLDTEHGIGPKLRLDSEYPTEYQKYLVELISFRIINLIPGRITDIIKGRISGQSLIFFSILARRREVNPNPTTSTDQRSGSRFHTCLEVFDNNWVGYGSVKYSFFSTILSQIL